MTNTETKAECRNCIFLNHDMMECRRRSPIHPQNVDGFGTWPYVQPQAWCGEFEAKTNHDPDWKTIQRLRDAESIPETRERKQCDGSTCCGCEQACEKALSKAREERDNLQKWYDSGMKCAQSFLDKETKSHIVDAICLIGWERDRLRVEVSELEIQRDLLKCEKGCAEQAAGSEHKRSDKLRDRIKELEKPTIGDLFIRHIQDHLDGMELVVCKICGKTALEIERTHLKGEASPDRQNMTPDTNEKG